MQLSLSEQCNLLAINRIGLYYKPIPESDENLLIMRFLDEQYFKTPFYGILRLTITHHNKKKESENEQTQNNENLNED